MNTTQFKKGDRIIIDGTEHGKVLQVFTDPSDQRCGMIYYKDANGFGEYAYDWQCELA